MLLQLIFIPVKREFPPHLSNSFALAKGYCSKCRLSKSFMVVIRLFSTHLLKPNFHVSSSHRHSTTVSLETRICFLHIILCFSLFKSQGIPFLLEYSKPLLESHNHLCSQLKNLLPYEWLVLFLKMLSLKKSDIFIWNATWDAFIKFHSSSPVI